jgi:hypothetical protein
MHYVHVLLHAVVVFSNPPTSFFFLWEWLTGFAVPGDVESSSVSIVKFCTYPKKILSSSIRALLMFIWNFQDAPAGDDDDDLDLFGDETEDDKKAAEDREAAKKASSKKKESKFYL